MTLKLKWAEDGWLMVNGYKTLANISRVVQSERKKR